MRIGNAKHSYILKGYFIKKSNTLNHKNVRKNMSSLKIIPFTENDYKEIGINFSRIASKYNISCQTCFEKEDLVKYGFAE